MTLGILVNSDAHPERVIGIAKAALGRGHEVIVFAMDRGTRLMADPSFSELSTLPGLRMGYCTHNAESTGAQTDGLPEAIVAGSQYENAQMNNEAHKVIVI